MIFEQERANGETEDIRRSVQKEFSEERRALKDFIHGDALLRRFFVVFLFEDLPASGRRADEVYLNEVDQSVDFVMSKIDRAVGTRALSNQAPVTYELPRMAVAEAIVNAIQPPPEISPHGKGTRMAGRGEIGHKSDKSDICH